MMGAVVFPRRTSTGEHDAVSYNAGKGVYTIALIGLILREQN